MPRRADVEGVQRQVHVVENEARPTHALTVGYLPHRSTQHQCLRCPESVPAVGHRAAHRWPTLTEPCVSGGLARRASAMRAGPAVHQGRPDRRCSIRRRHSQPSCINAAPRTLVEWVSDLTRPSKEKLHPPSTGRQPLAKFIQPRNPRISIPPSTKLKTQVNP
jgi:hypothetical protein